MIRNPEQTFKEHHDLARKALERLDGTTATRHLSEARAAYDEIQRQQMFGSLKDTHLYQVLGAEEEKEPDYHGMLIELREDCDHQRNIESRASLRREGWSERGIDMMTKRQRGLNEIVRFWDGDPRPQEMPAFMQDNPVLVEDGDVFVPGVVKGFNYDGKSGEWGYEVVAGSKTLRTHESGLVRDTRVE